MSTLHPRQYALADDSLASRTPAAQLEPGWVRPARSPRSPWGLTAGFRLDDRVVRPNDGTISGPEGIEHVEPKVMQVLVLLAQRPGQVVSRRELLDAIWEGDPDSDEALTRAVCSLRKHLGDSCQHPSFLGTVYKRGYRLIHPVDLLEGDDQTAFPINGHQPTTPPQSRPSIFNELRRRKVFRVASVYAIVGWLVVEVGDVVFPAFNVPQWGITLLVLLIVLGFPFALGLAWALQITSGGVALDMPIMPIEPDRAEIARRGLHYVVMAALAVAVAVLGFRLVSLESNPAFAAGEQNIEIRGDSVPADRSIQIPKQRTGRSDTQESS